jgi:Mg-chelatase subunit ChlD
MSWSESFMGKPAGVAAALRAAAQKSPCAEPEETFRKTALELAAQSAEANQADRIIRVDASGSMWRDGSVTRSNQLSLKVETLPNVWVDPPAPAAESAA